MSTILFTVATLTVIGLLAAVILYFTARKFHVDEDGRIDEVQEMLPGANCGGCGTAGCRAFAEKLVQSDDWDGLLCPVGGDETMQCIAAFLGKEAKAGAAMEAVVRCSGSCSAAPAKNLYDGVRSCAVANNLYSGESGCAFGCLGCGDCAAACQFGGVSISPETGLPVIDHDLCTGCGSCVKACPRHVIELRRKAPKGRRIYVSCINQEKGAAARKNCTAACIGCGKCQKVCTFDAIVLENNVAWIDSSKCRMCRKCVEECPTHSIIEENFPPRKVRPETAADTPAEQLKPVVQTISEPSSLS